MPGILQFQNMERSGKTTVIAVMAVLFFSFSLSAGEIEDETGITLGIKLIGASLNLDDEDDTFIEDTGAGLQLDFAYRFNPVFSLELSLGGAGHETEISGIDAFFGMGQLLAYYRFRPDGAFRPYIKGGFGGYSLEIKEGSESIRMEGGGFVFGGGVRYFFTEHVALGLDLAHNIINYNKGELKLGEFSIETDIDEDGSQTSVGLGFSYSF